MTFSEELRELHDQMNAGIQAAGLCCLECRHTWTANILVNVLVKIWVLHIRSLRCPKCGGRKLAFAYDG